MAISKIEKRVLDVLQHTQNREYQKQFLTNDAAFSRIDAQKMSFEEMTLFMISNTGKSLSLELLDFFNKAENIEAVVTKQALSKQRQSIRNELFMDLNRMYAEAVYQDRQQLFHGRLLIAVDGSSAEIPNTQALKEQFGAAKSSSTSRSNAKVGLNGFYDPLNHLMLKLVTDRYQKNETKVFLEHLDSVIEQFPTQPLCFLFDRGYISLPLLFELDKRQVDYLFRLPSTCYKNERATAQSNDEEIDIKITKSRVKTMAADEQLDYLAQQTKSARLVQVELESGETEVLLTSLPASVVPYEEMKDFYYQRWEIERVFNLLKNRLHIENISARTPQGVLQDIQATVFLGNIIEDIVHEANAKLTKKEQNKYEYRVNVNHLCGVVKNYFLYFFHSQLIDENRKTFYYQQLTLFLRRTAIANKTGLKNPRNKKVSRNKYDSSFAHQIRQVSLDITGQTVKPLLQLTLNKSIQSF